MSDIDTQLAQRGIIRLHNGDAIGLQPEMGKIKLYPAGGGDWMVGIRVNIDMRHYRAQGETSSFMQLEYLELTIPAPFGSYVARISGWDHYKTNGYFKFYKPLVCKFLPKHPGFTTYALLDACGEADPYYYAGWAFRTDHLPPAGYRRWTNVAYLGVNYPLEDNIRPDFVEVPPYSELFRSMKPGAPEGMWKINARFGGFTVDQGVKQQSYITLLVHEGRKRYYRGFIDFVKHNDRIVGENDENWGGIVWGNYSHPGELLILSGDAKGMRFKVVDQFFSPDPPLPGYPKNTWCLRTDASQPPPGPSGVKVGDEYLLTSPFYDKEFKLAEFKEKYGPGVYPGQEVEYTFEPV